MDFEVPRRLMEPGNWTGTHVATCHFERSEKSWSRGADQISPFGRNDIKRETILFYCGIRIKESQCFHATINKNFHYCPKHVFDTKKTMANQSVASFLCPIRNPALLIETMLSKTATAHQLDANAVYRSLKWGFQRRFSVLKGTEGDVSLGKMLSKINIRKSCFGQE